jgi:hypothetical protein
MARAASTSTEITRACGIMERNEHRSEHALDREVLEVPAAARQEPWVFRTQGGWPNIEGGNVGTTSCSHRAWGRQRSSEGESTSDPSEPATLLIAAMLVTGIVASAGSSAAGAAPPKVRVVPVATLANPVGFTFTPGGRIVYAERDTGEVRFLNPAPVRISCSSGSAGQQRR